jgi:glycosyltransferase involved in cell wall biosynthesis
MPEIKVITTCTDLDLFKYDTKLKNSKRTKRPFTVGYVGSVGVWYLFDESLKCFKIIKEVIPNAKLHIINREGHEYIYERLQQLDIDLDSVTISTADRSGVANAMQFMDIGLFMIKPVYSKIASTPTKLGEFLGCGVPCLCNSGVGDVASIIRKRKVGIALDSFDEDEMRKAVRNILDMTRCIDIKERCRGAALRHFSLYDGVKSYNEIYHSLSS